MQLPTIPKVGRLSRKHKITAAGAAAATAVVLTVTGLQASGGTAAASGGPTGFPVSTGDQVKSLDAQAGMASQRAMSDEVAAQQKAAADAAAKKAAAEAAVHKKAQAAAVAKQKAVSDAAARQKAAAAAAEHAHDKQAANRSKQRESLAPKPVAAPKAAPGTAHKAPGAAPKVVHRPAPKPAHKPVHKAAPKPAPKVYRNNLDGWIRHSLDIMAAHHIPGSYNGIHRNIIRESSGNPNAINLWDSNAAAGIPSKGLLQVIGPTFQTYHVAGTSWNIYNPVSNIAAACNYAFHVYGSIDNVNSAY